MNFKKFGSRVAAVAATMAVVASMSAISVSAADYGNNTAPTTPSVPEAIYESRSTSNNEEMEQGSGGIDNSDKTGAAAASTTSSDSTSSAVDNNTGKAVDAGDVAFEANTETTLDLDSVGAVLSADVLKNLAATEGASLSVSVAAGGGSDAYTVFVDSKNVQNAKNLNVGMKIYTTKAVTSVNSVQVNSGAVVISPKANEDLGAKVVVKLDPATVATLGDLTKVRLFVVKNGVVTLDTADLAVDENGNVYITFSDASADYVLSSMDLVKADEKADAKTNTKSVGALPGTSKGVAALGLIDASAISVAAILAKKKKKK